ncbi:SusC/RagA family TonB-linked outer membrane protein [Spirosoma utsteinense]|uniref:TonB-linked SusC/RagA family outer membrane protein n=1 Tax=Spirosoma utsteinense TaxID=2585773 RepID=A0ABR6W7X2_9BACT|nr:SusC/RagA family TonB-linked outer membrane protein [Spirosoma utsteinense]MBC3785840.1 TonB-linked SusC/RagA family outer membrane protein [Spirosoma utsteinense]MBC3792012.1 TonB-linked SusC/RagA family outer membrane protein [Spirosoma utsteinense]
MKGKLLICLCLLIGLIGTATAQSSTLTGKVTDSNGTPLPGVSVLVKGTGQGATTEADGTFRITAPANAKIGISYIGFLSQEITVGNRSTLNVTLSEDTRQLEEVVVSGLATTVKRSNLANAVTRLDSKDLTGTTTPVTTDGALQGKIAGANIVANSSVPGGGFNLQFRGVSTLGASASQPLFIVDGVYIDNGQYGNGRSAANKAAAGSSASPQDNNANRLADLNPDDIESVEVLKGSSAAAIYGTRANAGVVIITTKRGKGGKTTVSFGQDIGFSKALSYYGGADWTEQKLTDYFAPGDIPLLRAARANGTYTNWEKVMYGGTGAIRNSRLGITGGNEKTKFYVNGSISDETGIIKNTGFQRYSIRANVDHKLTNWLDFSINSNYIVSNNDRGWTGNDNSYVNYGYSLPYTKPYANLYPDANGNYPDNISGVGENPLAIRDRAVNNQKNNRVLQGFTVNARAINTAKSSLTFRINGGLDYQNGFATVLLPADLQSQRQEANPGFAQDTRTEVFNSNVQVSAIYTHALMDGRLNLTSSAGAVRLYKYLRSNYVRGTGLPAGVSNPSRGKVIDGFVEYQNNTDVGVFAQQDANYEDKIIGSVGIRFDKSTLNSEFDRFYAFPRAALAVNAARFGTWAGSKISQLKFRVAYGQTAGLPTFGTTYSQLQVVGVGGLGGLVPSTVLGNVTIQPERATELEYGIDFGLFNNRITGEFTLYNKKVFDLIQPLTTAPTTGVTSTQINAADLTNRGLEFSLGADVVRSENFKWFIQPIFWYNRSKITRLEIPERLTGGFGATFGQWRVKGPDADGTTYSPTEIVGQPRTLPATDPNFARSWTSYGDAQPKYELSLNNRITFLKNFEFSALLNYRHKFTVVSLTRLLWDEGGNTSDWSETDDLGNDGSTPNGIYRQGANGIDEGSGKPKPGANPNIYSFLKLREAALYYRVPTPVLKRAFGSVVSNVRVGISGNNLLRWTDYTAGYDPENSNFGSLALGAGVDLGSTPAVRRMMFHIAVDF